jgi:hypothetical protein
MTKITLDRAVAEQALHVATGAGYPVALIAALRDALAEPQEPVAAVAKNATAQFDHAIGADRFKVVRGAFWWHVLIGDSTKQHGKFHSRAGAEQMAADLLREFRNGAFVQHTAPPTLRAALAEPVQEPGFWGRVAARQASKIKQLETAAQQAGVMLKTGMPEYNTDDVLEVLEAALEALEAVTTARCGGDDGMDISPINAAFDKAESAREALKAALAEPVQPVAWRTFDGEGGYDYRTYEDNEDYAAEWAKRNPRHVGWVEPVYTAPPQRPVGTVQEPVAWMVYTEGGTSAYVTDNPNDLVGAYRALALFTSPPQRKPLSDEELDRLWREPMSADWEHREFARAIEAAHGIKEEK